MKKYLSVLMLLGASMTIAIPQASAETTADAPKKTAKKTAKKAPAKRKAAPAAADEDDGEPDVTKSASTDYQCEHGNKLTIYKNETDDKHIALRWNKRLHRLTRVDTTTGANRFENRKFGLVWIGIPAKGMLLDAKKGQQLANDCKDAEQMKPKAPSASASDAPAAPAAPTTQTAPETSKS